MAFVGIDRELPPRLSAIRESALKLAEKAESMLSEFDFVYDVSVMEKKADAWIRGSFHQAVPQFAPFLPKMMQLPNRRETDKKYFFVPSTQELYTSPDASKYVPGVQMAIFDPGSIEFLGLDRIRALGASNPAPTLWGYLQALAFEQGDNAPLDTRTVVSPYLTAVEHGDIDHLLEKLPYYLAGTDPEATFKQLLSGIRKARETRDQAINTVINKYSSGLQEETQKFCSACAAAIDPKMPQILKLIDIPSDYTDKDRYDATFDIKSGRLSITLMERKKRFWRTVYIPDKENQEEAGKKDWCVLFRNLYAKASTLLKENLGSSYEDVMEDIKIPFPHSLILLNKRIPYYNRFDNSTT